MSHSIDERIVEMQFNNGEFEKGIQQSLKSLDALKKGLDLDKSAKSLDSLQKTISNVDFSAATKGIQALSDRFNTLGGVLKGQILDKLAYQVTNLGKSLAGTLTTFDSIQPGFGKYAQKTEAVQTIMSATGKSIEEVEAVLGKLNEYTDWTSFNFAEMTSTIGKFVSNGVDLEVAERAMEGIGNEASLAGASIQNANHAMYNFAQALSSGKVQLMDWKSIELANMATSQFKNTIIETAIELGTLNKVSDDVGKTVKGTEVNFRTFNSTLSEGWFTSDVLTATLEKYADTSTELGQKAFDAAKKAITFAQAMDSVKDAASTGWMKTFQIVFGNFEEASALWTGFADGMIEIVDKITTARNELLEGWRDLDGEDGRTILLDGLVEIYEVICDIIGVGKDVISSLFPPITAEHLMAFSKAVKSFADNLKKTFSTVEKISSSSLFTAGGPELNLRGNAVQQLEKLDEILQRGSKNDDVKKMQERLQSIGYSLDKYGADGIFGPETEAALKKFQEEAGLTVTGIYDEATHKTLGDKLAKDISEATGPLETAENYVYHLTEGMEKLQRIFKGVFGVLHIGATVIGFIFNVVKSVLSLLAPIGDVLLTIGAVLGDCLSAVDEAITQSGIFELALAGIQSFLKPIGDGIKSVSDSIVQFFTTGKPIKTFTDLWTKLSTTVKKSAFWDKLVKAFEQIKSNKYFESFSKFLELGKGKLQNFINGIKKFFGVIKDGKKPAFSFSGIIDKLKNAFMTFLGVLGLGPYAIATGISKVMDFVGGIIESAKKSTVIQSLSDRIKGFFDSVRQKGGTFFKNVPTYLDKFKQFFRGLIPENFSLTEAAKSVTGKIVAFFTDLYNSLDASGKLTEAWNKTKDVFNNIISEIQEFGKLLGDAFSRFFASENNPGGAGSTSLFTAGGDPESVAGGTMVAQLTNRFAVFGGVVDWLKSKWEWLSEKLGGLFEGIKAFFSSLKIEGGNEQLDAVSSGFVDALKTLNDFLQRLWDEIKVSAPLIVGIIKDIYSIFLIKTITGSIGKLETFLEGFRKDVQPMALSILEIASAIGIIAGAMYFLSTLPLEGLAKGGVAIGVISGILIAFAFIAKSFKPDDSAKIQAFGISLLAIAAAIGVMALVVALIAQVGWDTLGWGLLKAAAVMAVLTAFIFAIQMVNKLTGQSALAGVGILAAVGAVAALALLAKFMKVISWPELEDSLKKIAVIMGLIAAFILAIQGINRITGGSGIGNMAGLLVAVAAIGILSGIAAIVGKLSKGTFWRGFGRLAAITGVLALFIGGLSAINKKLGGGGLKVLGNLGQLVMMIAAIGAVAYIMVELGKLDPKVAEQGTKALWTIVGALGVLEIAVGILGKTVGLGAIVKGSLGLIAVAAALGAAISAFGTLAYSGIDSLSSGMFVVGSALEDFNGMVSGLSYGSMDKAIAFLKDFCGFAAETTGTKFTSLRNMSGAMTRLGTSIKNFSDRASGITDDLLENVKNFGKTLKSLQNDIDPTKADAVATAIGTIGGAITLFYDGLNSVTIDSETNPLTDLAGKFQEIANALPEDADIDKISGLGENGEGSKLNMFAIGIENIGTAMNKYSEIAGKANLEEMQRATEIVDYFAGLQSHLVALTAAEGVLNAFGISEVEDPIGDFSSGIETLAGAMSNFATTLGENQNYKPESMSKAIDAIDRFAGIQKNLSATGGIVQAISGWPDLGKLASQMSALGKGISSFATETSGITVNDNVNKAVGVVQQLAKSQGSLQRSGGLLALMAGDLKLGDFASNMEKLGNGIVSYVDAIGSTTFGGNVSSATVAIGELAAVNKDLNTWWNGSYNLAAFGEQLTDFAIQMVGADVALQNYNGENVTKALASAKEAAGIGLLLSRTNFTTGIAGIADDIQSFYERLTEGIPTLNASALISGLTDLINSVPTAVSDLSSAFGTIGTDIVAAVANGVSASTDSISSALNQKITAASGRARQNLGSFEAIGRQIAAGVARGIRLNSASAISAVGTMMSKIVAVARQRVAINSPSKVFAEMGMYMDQGLANGLTKYANLASTAAAGVADSALDATRETLNRLNSVSELGLNGAPTITPVLDLSNVSAGAGRIGGLLSGYGLSFGIRGAIGSAIGSGNSDIVNAIGELNNRVDQLAEAMTHLQVVTETGALVGQIAPEMDRQLGKKATVRGRMG